MIRDISYHYLGSLISSFLSAAITIVLINFFTVEDYGKYSFYLSFFFVIQLLSNFGINGLLQKKISISSEEEKGRLFFSYFLLKILITVPLSVLVFIIVSTLGSSIFLSLIVMTYIVMLCLNDYILGVYMIINMKIKDAYLNICFHNLLKLISIILCFKFSALSLENVFLILSDIF